MRKINIGSCILYSKSEAANSDICWNPRVLQLKANRILDILGKTSLFITQSSGSHSKGKNPFTDLITATLAFLNA